MRPVVLREIEDLLRLYFPDVPPAPEWPIMELQPKLLQDKVLIPVMRKTADGLKPSAEFIVNREGSCFVTLPPEAHPDFVAAMGRVARSHRKYFAGLSLAVYRQLWHGNPQRQEA